VTDLSAFKRYVKTQCATGLNNTNGKPRCDAAARKAIGNGLWARIRLLAAAVDSPGAVKELHAKGEAAFVAEAGDKARVWWNQSGNSEAAKMKSAWFEAAKKRAAAGAPPESPRRSACLLPLSLCKPQALTVALKTALICISEAPCERDLTERRKRIFQHREQSTGARACFVTGLPPPPSSCYYVPWLLLGVKLITEITLFVRCSVRYSVRCLKVFCDIVRCFTVFYGAVRCRTALGPSVGPCVIRCSYGVGSARDVRSAPLWGSWRGLLAGGLRWRNPT
jgi:hypothetical protein